MFLDGQLVPNTELGHIEIGGEDAELRASDAAREREGLSWSHYSRRLDQYLQTLEKLFSPDLIIIGGGASKKSDKFIPRLHLRTEVIPAALLNNAGIVGAALAAAPAGGAAGSERRRTSARRRPSRGENAARRSAGVSMLTPRGQIYRRRRGPSRAVVLFGSDSSSSSSWPWPAGVFSSGGGGQPDGRGGAALPDGPAAQDQRRPRQGRQLDKDRGARPRDRPAAGRPRLQGRVGRQRGRRQECPGERRTEDLS